MSGKTWLKATALVLMAVLVLSGCGKKDGTGSSSSGAAASENNDDSRPVVSRLSAGDFGYVPNENKDGVIIVYMTATASSVVIPDRIDNLPVTGIVTYPMLFYENKNIHSVTFPATVTEIPDESFSGCTGLTEVNMPGVTTIGENAFKGCTDLKNITMPKVITIGTSAFEGCINLVKVTLPEGLTTVGDKAFSECINLSDLSVPASLTQFPFTPSRYVSSSSAFEACFKLPLVVRDKLESQGYMGFDIW